MTRPQSGVLPESSSSALFVTLLLKSGGEALDLVRRSLSAIPRLTSELAQAHGARVLSVVGVGSEAWDRLFAGRRPQHLAPFPAMQDEARSAPATPADLLLHLRSERRDLNFLLLKRVMERFSGAVEVVEDIEGFRYLDSRDLTGFVDGTENPKGNERATVALVGAEEPEFTGGSYLHIQRYIHDLAKWEAEGVGHQEKAIGRTKVKDEELAGAEKPPTAHISRVVIQEDGEELEILRHSMPYGNASRSGLYFVAYGRTPHPFGKMLRRMVCRDGEGNYDHLLGYIRPVTGASFFAPSLEFLAKV